MAHFTDDRCNILHLDRTIRLQGAEAQFGKGRVEIFHQGVWGTVCDDDWDLNDAKVACRQLGFPGAIKILVGEDVEDGQGKIWLTDVSCTGNEPRLENCTHKDWGKAICFHNEDAGVECLGILQSFFLMF